MKVVLTNDNVNDPIGNNESDSHMNESETQTQSSSSTRRRLSAKQKQKLREEKKQHTLEKKRAITEIVIRNSQLK
jgi:hypothetical protein